MKLSDIVHDTRLFRSIIIKSGEYEYEKRKKFILAVSEYDILLAAECKASSIEQEEEITNYLIEEAKKIVTTSVNSLNIGKALCALIKLKKIEMTKTLFFWLGEYWAGEVFGIVSEMENAPHKELRKIYEQIYFDSTQNLQRTFDVLEFNFDLDYTDNNDKEWQITQPQRKFKTQLQIISEEYYPSLLDLYKNVQKLALPPKIEVYNRLINYSPNFEYAIAFLKEMKEANLKPNEISYNTLINKSQTFEQAEGFLKEMKAANLTPNEISYSTLINKSQTFEQAEGFLKEMKEANLKPNEISYNTLINKSQTFEQQMPYYQDFLQKFPLKKGNLKSEKNYNFLFTAIFKKIKNKTEWDFTRSEIYRLGLRLNDYTQSFYDTLAKKWQ